MLALDIACSVGLAPTARPDVSSHARWESHFSGAIQGLFQSSRVVVEQEGHIVADDLVIFGNIKQYNIL